MKHAQGHEVRVKILQADQAEAIRSLATDYFRTHPDENEMGESSANVAPFSLQVQRGVEESLDESLGPVVSVPDILKLVPNLVQFEKYIDDIDEQVQAKIRHIFADPEAKVPKNIISRVVRIRWAREFIRDAKEEMAKNPDIGTLAALSPEKSPEDILVDSLSASLDDQDYMNALSGQTEITPPPTT